MVQIKPKTLVLTLSKRENPFSKDFIKALTIALLFHLILFGLLRIERPNHFDHIAPSAPVSVTVEFHPPAARSPLPPQLSLSPLDSAISPELPSLPLRAHPKKLDYDREILSLEPDFSQSERIPYWHTR